jgi:hypothetical protein
LYTTATDVVNRALQYVGATRISTLQDNSKQAAEGGFAWTTLRQAELRRSVWRCCIRRSVLRPWDTNTNRFVAPAWVSGTSYIQGQIVQDTAGVYWICKVDNTASTTNAPSTYVAGQPQYWEQWFGTVYGPDFDTTVTYYSGEVIWNVGDATWYLSKVNGNLNHTPPNGTYWVAQTGATAFNIPFYMPLGSDVTINGKIRNVFPLPLYYLRITNPDPKVGSTATNVVSAGLRYNDYELEGNIIVSAQTDPILLRYVADVSDVTMLDPLLCEALAARIAYSICEPLTQSEQKRQGIAAAYQKFLHDAVVVNLIETGSTEPLEDDYILTRGPAGVVDNVPSGGQRNAGSPEG